MTVRTLVSHGCFSRTGITNVLSESDRRGIEAALRETDMTPLSDRLIGNLSGGERQRAYLAMLLAQDPDYLLIDEGTSSMDIAHQRKTMELFARLAQCGKSVVTVSHDLPLSFSISSQILVMKCGKVVLSEHRRSWQASQNDCVRSWASVWRRPEPMSLSTPTS